MVPSMTRMNHRYRGPVESVKMNDLRRGSNQDMIRIYGDLEQQQGSLQEISDALRSGSVLDTPVEIWVGDAEDPTEIATIQGYGEFASGFRNFRRGLSVKGGVVNG
jgi:hypothetical protein